MYEEKRNGRIWKLARLAQSMAICNHGTTLNGVTRDDEKSTRDRW